VNTGIEYWYRDAANYKQFETVILPGEITPEEIGHIACCPDSGEYFIPAQVGLEELQRRMRSFPDPEADHVWHELDEDAPTTELDVHGLANQFTGQWDINAAMKRMGMPPP